MFYLRFSVISALLLSVLASPLPAGPKTPLSTPWDDVLVKHKWNVIPDNWVSLGQPPDGTTLDLYIALKANHENALHDALYEVSQPGHPKYGAHLSKGQVADLVAPHPDTLELVTAWLEYNGVSLSSISTTHGGGWLTVTGVLVSQANQLLGASYQLFYHAGTNDTILRTVGYALPAVLHTHVQTVVPTTAFTSSHLPQQMPGKRPGGAASAQAGNVTTGEPMNMLSRRDPYVTPSVLSSMYKTNLYVPSMQEKNTLAIVGYENQYPDRNDLALFMREHRSDAKFLTFQFETISDVAHPSIPGMQANLGAEYTTALAYPATMMYYQGIPDGVSQYENNGRNDKYLGWLNKLLTQEKVPQTISVAYGSTSEHSITREYAEAVCKLFDRLGLRGVSILVASGDDGVGQGQCRNSLGYVQFAPSFPASCPSVTSVGGTVGGITSDQPEVANIISGGGFSIYFDRQGFQQSAVNAYFLNHLGDKYPGLYDPRGRGVPDITVQSLNYDIIIQGQHYPMSGTSCATHTAAAIISMINDYLIKNQRDPLGSLNPWLYGIGWMGFNDIIFGNNPGCGTPGFEAGVGWDPVTGLGSPNFRSIQNFLGINRLPWEKE